MAPFPQCRVYTDWRLRYLGGQGGAAGVYLGQEGCMSMRTGLVVAGVGVASLLGAGAWAGAQFPRWRPVPEPVVLSGSDLGFRVQGMYGEVPMGEIGIRVTGAWIDAQLGSRPPNVLPGPPPPPVPPVPPPVVPSPR